MASTFGYHFGDTAWLWVQYRTRTELKKEIKLPWDKMSINPKMGTSKKVLESKGGGEISTISPTWC